MATKLENLDLEKAHFYNVYKHLPGADNWCLKTIEEVLNLGLLQVSTAFEQAIVHTGGHTLISEDCADIRCNNGEYADAKLCTVRTSSKGTKYSAPIFGHATKRGSLRVQVYERKLNNFYYFVIPEPAYKQVSKDSSLEIPFELDGTPRKIPLRAKSLPNWWDFETSNFELMCNKSPYDFDPSLYLKC
jgi:hypothetical protein